MKTKELRRRIGTLEERVSALEARPQWVWTVDHPTSKPWVSPNTTSPPPFQNPYICKSDP